MTTPCEKLGYKVGDKFRCLSGHVGFEIGQIITLYEDDGSGAPLFFGKNSEYTHCDGAGGAYMELSSVEKINQGGSEMNKTITLTEEQYAAPQAGEAITIEPPKPKIVQWEPKGGKWYVGVGGAALQGPTTKWCVAFGNEFATKEQAEVESIAMRARNRLAAYVREFAPDWNEDWADHTQIKYQVYYLHDMKIWGFSNVSYSESPGDVYMPLQVAEELVKKLNSGEVVL